MIVFVLIGFVITIHLSAISGAREAQRMTGGGPWPQPRCGACCPPPQDCQREDSCRSGQSNPALWPHLHLHQHLHVRGSLRTLQLCSGLARQYKHCTVHLPRAPAACSRPRCHQRSPPSPIPWGAPGTSTFPNHPAALTLQLRSGLAGQYRALHCPPPSSTYSCSGL